MGGKGGGGGVDTSGLEAATREATALQKQIYEQTRDDVKPWYNMGVGSVNKLADLLGVSGGSVQNRQSIYDELLPQYTTQQTTGGGGNLVVAPDGRVYDVTSRNFANDVFQNSGNQYYDQAMSVPAMMQGGGLSDQYQSLGWRSMGPQATTSDIIDYEGLNAAVEARLGGQGTPDGYGSLLQRFGMDQFQEDPGFKFRQEEANKALERQMASQGITLGGAGEGEINPTAYRAMQELNQGLASQEYGNAYNRYVQDQLNTFNMLMGSAGMGQGSTGIMATAGNQYGTNVGNLQTGLASAQLNAQMAGQAQKSSMFGSLLGTAGQIGASYLMSDIRAKENINHIGYENGYPIYTFNYLDDSTTYKGVMAQDVEILNPDAVREINGVKHVDYDSIGVKMEVIH